MNLPLRVKPLAEFGGNRLAGIGAGSEEAVAGPGDEVVEGIAERARQDGQQPGGGAPRATQTAHEVQHRVGLRQELFSLREDQQAVRQVVASRRGHRPQVGGAP